MSSLSYAGNRFASPERDMQQRTSKLGASGLQEGECCQNVVKARQPDSGALTVKRRRSHTRTWEHSGNTFKTPANDCPRTLRVYQARKPAGNTYLARLSAGEIGQPPRRIAPTKRRHPAKNAPERTRTSTR